MLPVYHGAWSLVLVTAQAASACLDDSAVGFCQVSSSIQCFTDIFKVQAVRQAPKLRPTVTLGVPFGRSKWTCRKPVMDWACSKELARLGDQPIAKGGMNPEYGNQERIGSPHCVWTRVKVPGDQPGGGTTADFRWRQQVIQDHSIRGRQSP